jgi:hypothetical protein
MGGNVDDIKKKRSVIIIIRQYVNAFEHELSAVIGGNTKQFIGKLITKTFEELEVIRNNILFELNLRSNETKFYEGAEFVFKTIEKLASTIGYNFEGAYSELLQDPEFMLDLKLLSCECDISKYISPRSSIFIKLLKKYYMRYHI